MVLPIFLHISISKRLALLFAIVVVILIGSVGASIGADPPLQAIISKLDAIQKSLSPKTYYLTDAEFPPNQALNACDTGFHMASLYEILDPTLLKYAVDNPHAHKPAGDLGSGPPTARGGWIRTGYPASNVQAAPGQANCALWTSEEPGDYGTVVFLSQYFEDGLIPYKDGPPPLYITYVAPWWKAIIGNCGETRRVWCVKDY